MKVLRALTRVGPAFVIAAVVLGPGSLTMATKLGAEYGYAMLWLPLLVAALMAVFVALFMRFGISADKSLLRHCADTWGRWFAVLCGVSMFYIVTAFQVGNNTGVATAMDSLLAPVLGGRSVPPWGWPVVFNVLAVTFLFAFKRIYTILERMMTALVAVMLIAFFANLWVAGPDLAGVARGLVPSIPPDLDWAVAAGLVATTFSIAGAIFQTYLVRARGWKPADYRKGVADAASGIGMLALVSMVVLVTSAAVLHPRGVDVGTAADMAGQLQALFGADARIIFCVGFAAAAFSSFLVNAMIGGTLLADGLGLSDDLNSRPAKVCSAACLLVAMGLAILIAHVPALDDADRITLAQAGTMLAVPLAVVASLLVLLHPRGAGVRPLGPVGKLLVLIGCGVLLAVTVRSVPSILARLGAMFGP